MTVRAVTQADLKARGELKDVPPAPEAALDIHGDYPGIPQVIDKPTYMHLKGNLPADLWEGYESVIDARLASHEEGVAAMEKALAPADEKKAAEAEKPVKPEEGKSKVAESK